MPSPNSNIVAWAQDLARQLGVSLTDIYTDLHAVGVSGIPAGGTTGQILAKNSNTDYDAQWVDITNYFVMEES